MKSYINKTVLILFALFTTIYTLSAQRAEGDFGIGFQFGDPNGISMKFYNEPVSIDLLLAWKSNKYVMINPNFVFDKHINNTSNFYFLYGPGLFVIVNDNNSEFGSSTELGVSGLIGIDYLIDNFEIFAQAVPRINLTESSDINVGGGLGLRYYF